jgi:micrococcal nuclease
MQRLAALLLATLLLTAGCTVSPPADGGASGGANAGGGAAGDADLQGAETAGSVTVTVTRVVDGDTLKVAYENGTEDTVRLLGVDTPEVHTDNSPDEFAGVPDSEAGRDCLRRWGERASSHAKEQLTGETVTLYFDANEGRRGYYDRLLAYVVHDGSNFNYGLIAGGYARVYESSFTARDSYEDALSSAQADGTGVWECATDSPPTGTASASPDGGERDARTSSDSSDGRSTDGRLAVATIHADAEGNDNENLNDEYVVLENTGDTELDLSGWTVADEAGKTYTFGDVALGAGEQVTLHTGSGTDTGTDAYWGQGSAVWNNGGDTVTVRDADGTVVAERSY